MKQLLSDLLAPEQVQALGVLQQYLQLATISESLQLAVARGLAEFGDEL
jgi:hypothetical protein